MENYIWELLQYDLKHFTCRKAWLATYAADLPPNCGPATVAGCRVIAIVCA